MPSQAGQTSPADTSQGRTSAGKAATASVMPCQPGHAMPARSCRAGLGRAMGRAMPAQVVPFPP
eukprot:15450403-Alexandrium_andersonii.AAC.1